MFGGVNAILAKLDTVNEYTFDGLVNLVVHSLYRAMQVALDVLVGVEKPLLQVHLRRRWLGWRGGGEEMSLLAKSEGQECHF